jgi:[ribosomal protein S5]-alanine N-acetyltransferase
MSPDVTLPINGGFLRPLVEADVYQGYVDGLNDPQVNRYLDGVKASVQTVQSVCDFVAADRLSASSLLWGVWTQDQACHVGTVRLHGIEHRHGTAHIGICIFDRRCWGGGLGTAAITAATRWAIDSLALRWIEAGAYEPNLASHRAFLSAGYAWVFDIPGKYLFEGAPTTVKVFAART